MVMDAILFDLDGTPQHKKKSACFAGSILKARRGESEIHERR
jgi:hypothetical protein